MKSELLHIYGPLAIRSYGLTMVIALLIFTYVIKKDPRFKQLGLEPHFFEIMLFSLISGWVGGRILFLLTHLHEVHGFLDVIAYWNGGFSILGGIVTLMIALPLYLKKLHIPIIPTADLIGIYAPLLQGLSRFGCFFAGCCYGAACQMPWAITYTDSQSFAPLLQPLHPTQLYSAGLLLLIFAVMYFIVQKKVHIPGQLTLIYLFLVSFERFIIDFWRADRIFMPLLLWLSVHQLIALGIMAVSGAGYLWLAHRPDSHNCSVRI